MNKKHEPLFDIEEEQQKQKIEPLFQEESESTAIAIDGKITPITKQEVPEVDAASWETLTVSELYDQLAILENRIMYCNQYGQGEAVKQIGRGVIQLRAIINRKAGNEVKLI